MNALPVDTYTTRDDAVSREQDQRRTTVLTAVSEDEVTPLGISQKLTRISPRALELSRLYGRGMLRCSIGGVRWRFQWRALREPTAGIELRLRVGETQVALGLEGLGSFGTAIDVTRPEIPAGLHAAYLNGLGAALWQQLETITQRSIEVLDVRLHSYWQLTPECLGFEVGPEGGGPVAHGCLRPVDSDSRRNADLWRVLAEVSEREMPAAPLPVHLTLGWSAVAGSTKVTIRELQDLEEHDIVLIDDATPAPNALSCWLGAGPTRRRAGRLLLSSEAKLQMVQWGSAGVTNMSADAGEALPKQAEFADIPVYLRFELAQWNASLAEMAGLAPGTVLDLGYRVDEHSVSVWVEQRCIGKGQLVAIGERLGVRLVSVFGNHAATAAAPATDGAAQQGS